MSTTLPDYAQLVAADTSIPAPRVAAIIELVDAGCTLPFIARYRKEATGGAEDVVIQQVMERLEFHREFHLRRTAILESIGGQGTLTDALRAQIESAGTKTQLEDLYLPYRPRRRTRATSAREKGLEPLADRMWARAETSGAVRDFAQGFIDGDKGVASIEEALQGARDIVAERIVEMPQWRSAIRELTWKEGTLHSRVARGKKDTPGKFSDYYDHQEPVGRIASHRVLAILRGEKEGLLSVRIAPEADRARRLLVGRVLGSRQSIWDVHVRQAAEDGWDRLLSAQIETEIRAELKSRADRGAIDVFATNLEDLLMAAPFGARPILAIDPGFRTGCKVVVLSATGRLLDHGVIYPTEPRCDVSGAERALDTWFGAHPDLAAVVVGNGTGGRETFAVVRTYLKERGHAASAVMVSESGASIYSASEVARAELPDHDVTVRGAVSIGRRVQDPLAELVKIDPKSIGVGQYQHDVDQKHLKQRLDDVVVRCVNRVGVDVNTASPSILAYVSGLGPKLANSIAAFRDAHGTFASRAQLKKVPGLGAKTFEQAAGFLRVKGKNPLDDSAVHPERYSLVTTIARDLKRDARDLIGDRQALAAIDRRRYVSESVGEYTLDDIIAELEKPGRDPRDDFEAVEFRDDVNEVEDLVAGMILTGLVTNVTNFGAFVDVGVHHDGLVHVSQIANRYVENPADELKVGQKVRVKVMDVDLGRKRIGLSIKEAGC
jgi:uncharacterized protein